MSLVNNENIVFTLNHADVLTLTETRWLLFRDVPYFIKKYVNGTTALDYGCGTGVSTRFLKSYKLKVDGVDISDDVISVAKQSDPTGKYDVVKSGKIPVNDGYYNLIFASWVLPYIGCRLELEKVIKEVSRCLEVGGIFIATVGNENTYQYEWSTLDARFRNNKTLNSGSIVKILSKETNLLFHNFFWTEDDYKAIFDSAGLRIIHVHKVFGKENDGYKWITERKKSFCDIYVVRKS